LCFESSRIEGGQGTGRFEAIEEGFRLEVSGRKGDRYHRVNTHLERRERKFHEPPFDPPYPVRREVAGRVTKDDPRAARQRAGLPAD